MAPFLHSAEKKQRKSIVGPLQTFPQFAHSLSSDGCDSAGIVGWLLLLLLGAAAAVDCICIIRFRLLSSGRKNIQRLHHSFTAHLHNNPAPSSCARCSNGQKLTAAAELEKITRSSGSLRNSGIKSGRIIPPDPDEFSDRPGGRWSAEAEAVRAASCADWGPGPEQTF